VVEQQVGKCKEEEWRTFGEVKESPSKVPTHAVSMQRLPGAEKGSLSCKSDPSW
jgi:hypothetical protein